MLDFIFSITEMTSNPWLNALLIIVFSSLISFIHEFGHAAMMKLSGLDIEYIEIGIFKKLFRAGKVKIKLPMVGGITKPVSYDNLEPNNKGNFKLMLISLGGVMAQFLSILPLFPFTGNSIILGFVNLNLLYIALNLLPIIEKRTCSDGMKTLLLMKYIITNKYALED